MSVSRDAGLTGRTRCTQLELPLRADAAAQARGYLSQVLRSWQCADDLVEDVLLVTSELVTNAVRHGAEHCSLHCEKSLEHLRIEVSDGSAALPRQRGDALDESGRGLMIVDAVASTWGVITKSNGKSVWAHWHLAAVSPPEQRTDGRHGAPRRTRAG